MTKSKKDKKKYDKEKLYQYFMEYEESNYDALKYLYRFSESKRVTIDRASYLTKAATFFENHYHPDLLNTEESLIDLINDFNKESEILEVIGKPSDDK